MNFWRKFLEKKLLNYLVYSIKLITFAPRKSIKQQKSLKATLIMLQQEFETLMGKKVTENEYCKANAIYDEAGNTDKENFVADYKKHQDSTLLQYFYESTVELRERIRETNVLKMLQARKLIRLAHQHEDSEIRKVAVNLVGEKNVVLMTIEEGLAFMEEDSQYVQANLY